MSLVIQKYGGTSLASSRHVIRCARHIVETRRRGVDLVVVVSAMGDATDDLLELASQLNVNPDRRSLDLLLASGEQVSTAAMSLAINAIGARFGCHAAALHVSELGILTDGDHCEAQIERIDIGSIIAELDGGGIVVVPGFQGITPMGHIATLGRGGSDITAVALAAVLRGRDRDVRCEIYTDVDGVFTADPHVVPDTSGIDTLSHDDMIELATSGARVLHPRSVMLARQSDIAIEVKLSPSQGRDEFASSFGGTLVRSDATTLEAQRVIGCTLQSNLVRFSIDLNSDDAGLAWDLTQSIIEHVRPVDITTPPIQSQRASTSILITVAEEHADMAEQAAARVLHNIDTARVTRVGPYAAVVVVGRCMLGEPRVLASLREAATASGAAVHASSFSDRRMVLVTENAAGEELLTTVHAALDRRGLIRHGATGSEVVPAQKLSGVAVAR